MHDLIIDIRALFIAKFTRRPFNHVRTELVISKWRKRGVKIGEKCYVNHDVMSCLRMALRLAMALR